METAVNERSKVSGKEATLTITPKLRLKEADKKVLLS